MNSLLKNKLFIFGVLTELIYLSFNFVEPLRKKIGETSITQSGPYLRLIIIGFLLLALLIYFFSCKQEDLQKKDLRIIIIFFLIFSATNFFIWPLSSEDIFLYISYARVAYPNLLNPYLVPYVNIPADALFPVLGNLMWANTTAAYGPLFILMGGIGAFLSGNNFILNIFLYKFFFILINIANGFFIYKITNSKKALLLYAWNPLILLEFTINGHNDVLLIFFMLAAIIFILKKTTLINYIISFSFIVLSILIKYITAIFLPLLFLFYFLKNKQLKEKLILLTASITTGAVLIILLFLPFWRGPETLNGVFNQINSVYHNMIVFASPAIILISPAVSLFTDNFKSVSLILGKMLFAILYAAIIMAMLIKREAAGKNDLIFYMCLAGATFYATFFNWFMPWYLPLLISMIIIYNYLTKKNLTPIIMGLTTYGLLYYSVLN